VPDTDKGEVIKAFVVPQAKGIDAEELLRWARENMSHYKVPRQLEIRDSLPASGTGKVLRRLLKENAR
jgi:long-chain acyl-CoA synthetase